MSIFGIPPSKTVGELKTAVREAILDGEVGNDYEAAKAYLLAEAAKLGLLPK